MPPLFDEKQQLDESKLVDSLANKASRSHKVVIISQGFNPETVYLATFVENCKQAETTYSIAVARFFASDKNSNNERNKKRSKFKEREEKDTKRRKKNSSFYCSLYGENKSHTSRDWKFLKVRSKDKYNPKYGKKYYKKKFRELNLLERESAHQRAKYLKYKKLNKAFSKKKTPKEDTVNLDDTSDSNSSSSSEADNSPDEN